MFISHFSLLFEFPKCDEEPFWSEINKLESVEIVQGMVNDEGD